MLVLQERQRALFVNARSMKNRNFSVSILADDNTGDDMVVVVDINDDDDDEENDNDADDDKDNDDVDDMDNEDDDNDELIGDNSGEDGNTARDKLDGGVNVVVSSSVVDFDATVIEEEEDDDDDDDVVVTVVTVTRFCAVGFPSDDWDRRDNGVVEDDNEAVDNTDVEDRTAVKARRGRTKATGLVGSLVPPPCPVDAFDKNS